MQLLIIHSKSPDIYENGFSSSKGQNRGILEDPCTAKGLDFFPSLMIIPLSDDPYAIHSNNCVKMESVQLKGKIWTLTGSRQSLLLILKLYIHVY